MRTENDFLDWLCGASIYIGYARYAQFGDWEFVIASLYDESDKLKEYIYDLDGGDSGERNALEAAEQINLMLDDKNCWMAHDKNPAMAMHDLINQIRKYYFEVLNKNNYD